MDLYFSYHDGQAVTRDEFVECMAEANGADLDLFHELVAARLARPGCGGRGSLRCGPTAAATLTSRNTRRPHPAAAQAALHIPVAFNLIGPDGEDLLLRLEGRARARLLPGC